MTESIMTVSIIIPVYKAEKYISDCLESICQQECDAAHVECILVDDCSPDGSIDVARKILSEYHGSIDFVLMRHDANRGPSAARNTAIKVAKGDFVLFVDADDKLEPGTIDYYVRSINDSGCEAQVDIVLGNSYVEKNSRPAMELDFSEPMLCDNADEYCLRKLLTREWIHLVCNKLVRKEMMTDHQALFEEGVIDEDLLWAYLIFLHARKVLIAPKVTYIYNDTPGSIMSTPYQRVAHIIRSRITICNKLLAAPPRLLQKEYFMYTFYVLIRAVNLYEDVIRNSKDTDGSVSGSPDARLAEDLHSVRSEFLRRVWKKHYFLLYLFFLTSVKPFYHLYHIRFFRRYYDNIAMKILRI